MNKQTNIHSQTHNMLGGGNKSFRHKFKVTILNSSVKNNSSSNSTFVLFNLHLDIVLETLKLTKVKRGLTSKNYSS